MFCLVALIIFSILGIFSASHRELAKEALDCVFRRITLRPCNTGFKEKTKSKVLTWLLNRSVTAAKIFNNHFEFISWIFFILMIGSTFWTIKGGYNFYFYGSCNGLNQSGFCAFDPKGENNKITELDTQCSVNEIKNEKTVSLKGVDLSLFPAKNINSKDTLVLIGCYDCDYTRKAYQDIQDIVKNLKTNYIFAHYPIRDEDKYLSNVAYCVEKNYSDKFWKFDDELFAADKISIYNKGYINRMLENFNFDVEKVNTCINSKETEEMVEKQFTELKKTGIYGTPTVFINNEAFVGPKPYRVYRAAIKKFIFF